VSTSPATVNATEPIHADWSRLAQRSPRKPAPAETDTDETAVKPLMPATAAGLVVTFTDEVGGTISLSQVDGRLQHRGTVAPRGPAAVIDIACREIGLPDHVARAFEFVAAWFGLPFDAVNLRVADNQILSWGFWSAGDAELAQSLLEWKRQAPETFTAHLQTFGIDVGSSPAHAGAAEQSERPVLEVTSNTKQMRGREAEWIVASEPRLLAALARAGRDRAAQKAQIDIALANWVTPVMFHGWTPEDDDHLIVDVLKSAAAVAALLYLVRRHGPRKATRLVHIVNERSRVQDRLRRDSDDAWVADLVRSLRHLQRENDAGEVLRITSSPELTIPRSEH
jgi:hypothetical protein